MSNQQRQHSRTKVSSNSSPTTDHAGHRVVLLFVGVAIFFSASTIVRGAVLASYDFSGNGAPTVATGVIASDLETGSGISVTIPLDEGDATGIDADGNPGFATVGGVAWTSISQGINPAPDNTLDIRDCLKFTIGVAPGYTRSLSSFTFKGAIETAGRSAQNWALVIRRDLAYSQILGEGVISANTTTGTYESFTVDLSDVYLEYTNTFMLCLYGAGTESFSSGTAIDNVVFNGSAIPEPTVTLLIVLGSSSLLICRRRST